MQQTITTLSPKLTERLKAWVESDRSFEAQLTELRSRLKKAGFVGLAKRMKAEAQVVYLGEKSGRPRIGYSWFVTMGINDKSNAIIDDFMHDCQKERYVAIPIKVVGTICVINYSPEMLYSADCLCISNNLNAVICDPDEVETIKQEEMAIIEKRYQAVQTFRLR